MKQGRTLEALLDEVERQGQSKRDFIVDSPALRMVPMAPEGSEVGLHLRDTAAFGIRPFAHGQIAENLGIPQVYYNRMLTEDPELLAMNANRWFEKAPQRRMVRTLDGATRAYLSDRYRPLDNIDLAQAVIPQLLERKDLRIESCEVTETRLYIKAVTERARVVKVGDEVQQGVVISNSEIGAGALAIQNLIWRLVCSNGAIMGDAIRKAHVGKKVDFELEQMVASYTDRTRALDDAALWSKVRDAVDFVLSGENFDRNVSLLEDATEKKLEQPQHVIEVIGKRNGLSEGLRQRILGNLIDEGDRSVWGLANSITRASQDCEDYDEATALERLGGEVITLGDAEWRRIAAEAEKVAA